MIKNEKEKKEKKDEKYKHSIIISGNYIYLVCYTKFFYVTKKYELSKQNKTKRFL